MTHEVNEKIIWKKVSEQFNKIKNTETASIDHVRLLKQAKQLLKEKDAVLLSHYYVAGELQDLAEESGGMVGDSLEMARYGLQHPASTVIVAGVKFMGETAKILSPEKQVYVIDRDAECSLDLSAPADEFNRFCDQHPDRTVVVYANTSAAVKARADWVVTSSIAVDVVKHLHHRGEKILWAPDKHLGAYIKSQTAADMILWNGSCVVHDAFKAGALADLKRKHPDAAILVHPESPADVIALADVVGSTTKLLNAGRSMKNPVMIVATDSGILHKMRQHSPHKLFIEAPSAGAGATCESCAHCPWMALNSVEKLVQLLKNPSQAQAIEIPEDIRCKAFSATQRMIDFNQNSSAKLAVSVE